MPRRYPLHRLLAVRLLGSALALLLGGVAILCSVSGVPARLWGVLQTSDWNTLPDVLVHASQQVPGALAALVSFCLLCAIAGAVDAGSKAPVASDAAVAARAASHPAASSGAAPVPPGARHSTGVSPQQVARSDDPDLLIAHAENDRLRERLQVCDRQLAEARAAQSRFVSRISHELRTPMNGILGMSDLLLESPLSDAQTRFVHGITSSSSGLLSVIDDLLDFARLEVGELRLERARFGLRDAVEDVCAQQAPAAHARGIELICYVDEGVPVMVDGDGKRLRQVIGTLVKNALEHTDEGEVVVRLVRESSEAGRSRYRCDVQDSGRGMSSELQLAMWRALDGEREGDERSVLGVAMTVAGALVSRMGGELRVRSRRGEGSRFSIDVELGDVADNAGARNSRSRLQGSRVLVVDDNRTNRIILEHQLGAWGMQVVCVDGGETALAALHLAMEEDRPFQACILDLNMPGMNGIAFAERVRNDARLPALPCLMLTSSEIQLDTAELDALGIRRNLSKPPRQSVLRDTLASLLDDDPGPAIAPVEPLCASVVATEDEAGSRDTAAPEPVVLDRERLRTLRRACRPGRPDLLARIIDGWQTRAPQLLEQLRQARSDDDLDGFRLALRAIASSAESLGALQIGCLCETLVSRIPERADTPLSRAIEDGRMRALERACEALQAPLRTLRDEAA